MIKNKKLTIILFGFGILYSLISLVNHYLLRTYALDLGAYSNALYDYSHFQWNDSTVFKSIKENLLADHFDLYLIIFSPLSLVFKTYTLLLVQLVFILLGGLGIYKYFIFSYKNEKLHSTIILTRRYFDGCGFNWLQGLVSEPPSSLLLFMHDAFTQKSGEILTPSIFQSHLVPSS